MQKKSDMVLAAIDIGSNAIRLLISNVFEEEDGVIFKKFSLTRVPIRLGEDAFTTGRISTEKSLAVIKAMIAFKHLMEIHQPDAHLALATSAMRNAANAERIIEEIQRQTNIEVRVIDGQAEAEIIYRTHIAEEMLDDSSYLYIEVGGGSTELSLFSGGRNVCSRSFPVGTVRMLHELVDKPEWKEMKQWVRDNTAERGPLVGIGTGGNINALLKMLNRKEGKPFSIRKLKKARKFLKKHSLEDRIKVLGLRPDRADVIMPATRIYLSVMKWAGIEKIIVPKIGLADGIVRMLYFDYRDGKTVSEQGPLSAAG